MIRPRGGDFYNDANEFEAMRRDIAIAKRLGVNAVVLGILNVNADVDVVRTRQLLDLARPLEVTFHRAFDMSADLFRALDDVCAAGVDRLLTSGGEQTSIEGAATIAQLVARAQGRIIVMPGSGIKPQNARSLVEQTGAREIHVGLRGSFPSPMTHRNQRISMGKISDYEYQRFQVLEENVRSLSRALESED
jgi:copper homeostasis protein